jgi:MoxR-like ATPase
MTSQITEICSRIRTEIHKVVVGQDSIIDLLLVALLSRGHVLLEGVPGTAKTLLARTFSASLSLEFKRIQFTPDLMPGDVIGTNLFNFQSNSFMLTKGALFTQILLADEINRTPPKTQSALLEAMQERSVTIDGTTHSLDDAFMVIATQNPIEQEGTYPLPEAQLDRFLFKLQVEYPNREEERNMVRLHGHRSAMPPFSELGVQAVATAAILAQAREVIGNVRLSDELVDYVVDLIRATREHSSLVCGASPRAANMLATAARAQAAVSGRDFVIPDDIKMLLYPALTHRVVIAPTAELEGISAANVLTQIIEQVPAPR